MASQTGTRIAFYAKTWFRELGGGTVEGRVESRALRLLFAALVLAGPRRWRGEWWPHLRDWLRWSWLTIDRPVTGPDWLERRILGRAVRQLAQAQGEDRLLLLQLIMRFAYACDSGWRPDFADPALLANPEIVHYIFDFPIFVDRVEHHERIVAFVRRLYADLDRLHAAPLAPESRAQIAGYVAHHYSFMPALFSDANLRPIARAAGRWQETYLRLTGHELDHEFAPRDRAGRLRVGVYVQNIEPRNESFLAVPFGLGLDRHRFETVLVSGRPRVGDGVGDGVGDRFGALVDAAFERVEVVDAESLAERVAAVRALDLDFLILANTITAQTSPLQRLYAHRLARCQIMPVAISPHTTGLARTDIALTAANTEPPDAAHLQYSETIQRLDGTFNCFSFGPCDPRLAPEETVELPAWPVTFACGGVIYKLGPALRESFIRLLQRVPGSGLVLYPFNPNWLLNPKALALRHALEAEFAAAGIGTDRLRILPAMTPAQILGLMRQMTVCLDTFPFSGGASVLEPIFASCPVVTLRGGTQRGLLGAGMLRALGLDELVADDVEAYEAKAMWLARSPEYRTAMAERLTQAVKAAPFLDPARFGRHLAAALEDIARRRF
jgi:predicted O-linked N-acetylglucosamine transferase (SPINDLY family)